MQKVWAIGVKGEEGYYFADDGFGNLQRVFFVSFSHYLKSM